MEQSLDVVKHFVTYLYTHYIVGNKTLNIRERQVFEHRIKNEIISLTSLIQETNDMYSMDYELIINGILDRICAIRSEVQYLTDKRERENVSDLKFLFSCFEDSLMENKNMQTIDKISEQYTEVNN